MLRHMVDGKMLDLLLQTNRRQNQTRSELELVVLTFLATVQNENRKLQAIRRG
jgi:hypothetical protein